MNRKYFFTWVLIFIFMGCVSSKNYNKDYKMHPLSVVQGATNKDSTTITVLYPDTKESVEFSYSEIAEDATEVTLSSFIKKHSPDKKYVVEQVQIKNLDSQKEYLFKIKFNGRLVDERGFKSQDLDKKNIRIGIASCMDDSVEPAGMWESYLNKFVDVNFFIGDNIYADKLGKGSYKDADVDQLWDRYIQTFKKLYFYHSSKLSPTYFLWDDHDFGKNDGGASYKYKEESLEIFNTFFPREEIKNIFYKTQGTGSVLNAFGQKFIFADGRFFREDKKGSHWGKEQKEQILSEIKKSKTNLVWLIQGDQFFGGYHDFESFEGDHPTDFKNTLKEIKSLKKKIVFISGDRHLTEIMKIGKEELGYPTYEITSSGIHAVVFPGAFEKHPNPRQEVGKAGVFNFTVLDISVGEGGKATYKVTSYGAKDWTHYTKELSF